MDGLQAALAKVEAEIEALGLKLEKVETEVETARARKDEAEVTQLRTKEGQLRTKEDKLRTEKLLLLQSGQGVLARGGGKRWQPSDAARVQADSRCKRTRLARMPPRQS